MTFKGIFASTNFIFSNWKGCLCLPVQGTENIARMSPILLSLSLKKRILNHLQFGSEYYILIKTRMHLIK